MYDLVQAGIIVYKALKELLKPYVYAPAKITKELRKHQDRYINFTLVLDNFSINYRDKKYVEHLISALQEKYEVKKYCTGGLYCGIKLK